MTPSLNRFILLLFALSLWASPMVAADAYDARIGEGEILTPPVRPSPRINGPVRYGVRPGKQFVYRIPTQGERPIHFEATGLPDGLQLDARTGIISGLTPATKGDYPISVTATNAQGRTTRLLWVVVGDKLALTPPVGWNSWGGHMLLVTDEIIRKAANVMVESGLADVGFQYVGIDDCWMRISPASFDLRTEQKKRQHTGFDYDGLVGEVRDAEGNILPNLHFPDMKAMTDHIHSLGLKAGLYSSPGPHTCQNFAGSFDHEAQDAAQYARWGFDLLKYDQCSGGGPLKALKESDPGFKTADFWQPMADALQAQDRDIVFNLCQYGLDQPWTWAPDLGIQSWRIGGDLNHKVTTYFEQALRIATELRHFSKPGQWNDPDFMYLGKIRDYRQMMAPTIEVPLDTNQRYQYVTLWSIICAPFFFSCDIDQIDEFTIRLLGNADVVGLNQDERGHVAEVIRNEGNEVVMAKKLADGSHALAIFNRDPDHEAKVDVAWAELGGCCTRSVYDVWRQRDLGEMKDGVSVELSPNGVALFILKE